MLHLTICEGDDVQTDDAGHGYGNNGISLPGRSFIRYSGVTAINYAGTIAEWDAITRDDAWIWGCYDVTLTCTDGTKTLSYTY